MAAEQKPTPCDWIGVLGEHSKACSKVGYVRVTKYKTSLLLLATTRFCDTTRIQICSTNHCIKQSVLEAAVKPGHVAEATTVRMYGSFHALQLYNS